MLAGFETADSQWCVAFIRGEDEDDVHIRMVNHLVGVCCLVRNVELDRAVIDVCTRDVAY